MATSLTEKEELLDQQPTPHLSYSQINQYLTCPEQYRLYYLEKLRPRIEGAGMVFGALVHVALADFFLHGTDPAATFRREWLTAINASRKCWKLESARGWSAKSWVTLTRL